MVVRKVCSCVMLFTVLVTVGGSKSKSIFMDLPKAKLPFYWALPNCFPEALVDIMEGLPANSVSIVSNLSTLRVDDVTTVLRLLNKHGILVSLFDLSQDKAKKTYFDYLKNAIDSSLPVTSFIICDPTQSEDLLIELTENNYVHRSLLYAFYWPLDAATRRFAAALEEAMRVALVTHPRTGVFRIYYNQASPNRPHRLALVNWWAGRLYKAPLLPPADKVYHDFQQRVFNVPVLHAPPWHFVKIDNDSTVTVTGGRDEKLLALLAEKLNFRYEYYDPPDRSQGTGVAANGTYEGILGLVWKRQADFFLGDVTMSWERLRGVEFSFLTLADSGAFVTHAPSKLSEALALVRPFQWDVWPLVVGTMVLAGPALWAVVAAPALWQPALRRRDHLQLLARCCWFTTKLFLRQSSGREPARTHKARLLSVLVSLAATYVIGDMYSANLTSLLARPAREPPVSTLAALERAMRERGYRLLVEQHSSSLAMLQNGTGVYGRLASLMRRQDTWLVGSVEQGVRLVLGRRAHAVLGGRETLYFDIKRFGANNFHLSEKLYTRYSAIALQIGCPFIENFNLVLMQLFEAGILSKITTEEYEKLGAPAPDERVAGSAREAPAASAPSERRPEPVSFGMLRGAFLLLGMGHLLAGTVLLCELEKRRRQPRRATERARHVSRRARFVCERTGRAARRGCGRVYATVLRALDRVL